MRYKISELTAGGLLLLGALFAWQNLRHLPDDAKMFPNMVLAVLSVATIIMIIRAITGASQKAQGDGIKTWTFAINTGRMFGGLALFAGYLLVVETLGYFTASALFIIATAAFAQYRVWPALVASTIAFCVFVYLVFVLVFARPLPEEFFYSEASLAIQSGAVLYA